MIRRPAIRCSSASQRRFPSSSARSWSLSRSSRRKSWLWASARSLAGVNWCCCNSLSSRPSSWAKPGRRALPRNSFNSSACRSSNARKTMTRPSSVKNFGGATFKLFEDELREPLEGKNVQPRVAGQVESSASNWRSSWNVACLGASKISGAPSGFFCQRGADFREAAEGFAAAGGAEEKARLHDYFHAKPPGRKGIYCE